MNRIFKPAGPVLLLVLLLSASGRSLTFPDQTLVESQFDLAMSVLADALRSRPAENAIVSPAAMMIQLTLLHDAAGSEGRQALTAAMGLPGYTREQLDAAASGFSEAIALSAGRASAVGVSFWAPTRKPVTASFNAQIAGLGARSIAADATGQNLTEWVKSVFPQNGSMKRFPQNPVGLVLAGLAKSRPSWGVAFDPGRTKSASFATAGTGTKSVPMMSQSGFYTYCQTSEFQAVAIPLSGGDLTVYLILPEKNMATANVADTFARGKWSDYQQRFTDAEGYIEVPRLKAGSDLDLADLLRRTRAAVLFNKKGTDLSAAIGAKGWCDGLPQRTQLELSEDGAPPPPPTFDSRTLKKHTFFNLSLNRPFLFLVRHNLTGVILLAGAVQKPD